MPPLGEGSDAAEEAVVVQAEQRPISNILIIIALPLVNKFQLKEEPVSREFREMCLVFMILTSAPKIITVSKRCSLGPISRLI